MGKDSGIQWTHHTHNIVWGCAKVSEACKHCYAETFAKRVGLDIWGADKSRRVLSDGYWRQPLKWNRIAAEKGERHRVFCSSMADVFEDHPTVAEQRARLWPIIAETPALDWLLLTKRPENMVRFAPAAWAHQWPRNVWAGTTAETQERLDERIRHLFRAPAAVRFLSCEPLLGPLDLTPYLVDDLHRVGRAPRLELDWVIVGGESGPKARPFDVAWARSIVSQCRAAGVAPFVKQIGANPQDHGAGSDWPEGVRFRAGVASGTRVVLRDGHGGDADEWPEDLRVREFPEARA